MVNMKRTHTSRLAQLVGTVLCSGLLSAHANAFTFEWVPSEMYEHQNTTFHWNVPGASQCFKKGSSSPREASGTSGPWSYSASTYTTQWYCQDSSGNRMPSSGYYEATRKVVKRPVKNKFYWSPSTVEVGQPTTFHWDIDNVVACYKDGTGSDRGTSGTSGPWTYTTPGTSTTNWRCVDQIGNSHWYSANRTVVAPVQPPTSPQVRILDMQGNDKFLFNIGEQYRVSMSASGDVDTYELTGELRGVIQTSSSNTYVTQKSEEGKFCYKVRAGNSAGFSGFSPTVCKLVDNTGYNGVFYQQWFSTSQRPEMVQDIKYSGNFATYTAKHRPLAIYSQASNKTFFTYGSGVGTFGGARNLGIYVSCFDHATDQLCVPTPVTVKGANANGEVTGLVDDPHDNAAILIDEANYIWVYVSGRGSFRPMEIYRSSVPGNHSSFIDMTNSELSNLNSEERKMSYPQPWLVENNAGQKQRVLIHNRYTNGRELYFKRPGQKSELMVAGGHYAVSDAKGKHIVIAYNSHGFDGKPPGYVDNRSNLYFMESKDGGATWNNSTSPSTALSFPLVKDNSETKIKQYFYGTGDSRTRLVYLKDIKINSNGTISILYVTSTTPDAGAPNASRDLVLATKNGTSWSYDTLRTDVNHNYSTGFVSDNGNSVVFPFYKPGANREQFAGGTLYKGTLTGGLWSWSEVSACAYLNQNHNYVRDVYNGKSDFQYFWAQGDGLQRGTSQYLPMYYFDGSNSREMPYSMSGNQAGSTQCLY